MNRPRLDTSGPRHNRANFRCKNPDCKRGYSAAVPDKLPSPREVAKLCPEKCSGCGAEMDRDVGEGPVHFGLLFQ